MSYTKSEYIERFGYEKWLEWAQHRKEYLKKYYEQNKEKIQAQQKEYSKQWYKDHKDYVLQQSTEYAKNNPEVRKKAQANYRKNHKDKIVEYSKSMVGRAVRQATTYRVDDREHGRGESTITYQYILEQIYTQPCVYCGETSWKKLGCDRINNDLPHTPENVVCSCWDCNTKRGKKDHYEFLKSCYSHSSSVSLSKDLGVDE